MNLVSQDFCFKCNSLEHGQFIVSAYDMYADGFVTEIRYIFPLKSDHLYLNFQSPPDVAAWLKLKFGNYLVERPKMNSSLKDLSEMLKKATMDDYIKQYQTSNVPDYFDIHLKKYSLEDSMKSVEIEKMLKKTRRDGWEIF